MTTTFELPDEQATHLINILDRNARADSIETSFYWREDDIERVQELRNNIAEQREALQ